MLIAAKKSYYLMQTFAQTFALNNTSTYGKKRNYLNEEWARYKTGIPFLFRQRALGNSID